VNLAKYIHVVTVGVACILLLAIKITDKVCDTKEKLEKDIKKDDQK
jgi:hypothetical protein